MYLTIVAISLGLAYWLLLWALPKVFALPAGPFRFRSLLAIIFFSVGSYLISFQFTSVDWENRFLHVFGGGFAAVLVVFLACRDAKLPLKRSQFITLAVLLATTFGTINELLEFPLQRYPPLTFAESTDDTWLDLVSNTVGIIHACLALFPASNFDARKLTTTNDHHKDDHRREEGEAA